MYYDNKRGNNKYRNHINEGVCPFENSTSIQALEGNRWEKETKEKVKCVSRLARQKYLVWIIAKLCLLYGDLKLDEHDRPNSIELDSSNL